MILFLIFLICSFPPGIDAGAMEKAVYSPQKEKTGPELAKPGRVIFIGVISPELAEVLSPEKPKDRLLELKEELKLAAEVRQKFLFRLQELEKERQVLTGDFYGLNQYGHRYALIFDRLGYIRYRLHEVNEEIKEIKKKLAINSPSLPR